MTKRKDYKLTPEELDEIKSSARRHDAEAIRARAEAKKAEAETGRAEAWCKIENLALKQKQMEHDEIMAQDANNQVYNFDVSVNQISVRDCMEHLNLWSRTKPKCDMEIVFTSPGGSIVDGMRLYDHMQMLKRKGHCITTKTYGMAASMAGILLQAGTERVAGKESWVLIHQASFVSAGKIGEVEDTVLWIKRVCERIVDIFAERASAKSGKSKKEVASFVRRNWERKDWWLSSDDCLKHGFVDRIE